MEKISLCRHRAVGLEVLRGLNTDPTAVTDRCFSNWWHLEGCTSLWQAWSQKFACSRPPSTQPYNKWDPDPSVVQIWGYPHIHPELSSTTLELNCLERHGWSCELDMADGEPQGMSGCACAFCECLLKPVNPSAGFREAWQQDEIIRSLWVSSKRASWKRREILF